MSGRRPVRSVALALAGAVGVALLGGPPAASARPAGSAGPAVAAAAQVPAGFSVSQLGFSLQSATAMAFLPDGRLLVAEQAGRLRVVRGSTLLATPLLTVPVDATRERGLIGVAVDPAFASNGFVYVHYTVPASGTRAAHARIERWTVPAGSDVAAPGSRRTVLDLPPLGAGNHNGGAIHFGTGGKLYVAIGENAVPERAQDLSNPFGKVLRVEPATGAPVGDNPFVGRAGYWTKRIWAYGLRNPFTFAVSQRTSRLHLNDVGQDRWEEINLGRAGANYGWPVSEGPDGAGAGITRPVEYYGHDQGCSIAGGAFYEASAYPADYAGDYFYGDYCGGWVRAYDVATDRSRPFADGLGYVVDLTVGPGGALNVLTRGGLWRVTYTG